MTITIIRLKTELLKKIADSSKDCFNIRRLFSFKSTIAIQTSITINEVSKVMIAVKIFDKYIVFLLTGNVFVRYDSSLYLFFANLA